jgi:small subunit ribosomal protein S15
VVQVNVLAETVDPRTADAAGIAFENRRRVIEVFLEARRNLRRLVHQRGKLLNYLKRTDRSRYDPVLGRLGVEPGGAEGKLVV